MNEYDLDFVQRAFSKICFSDSNIMNLAKKGLNFIHVMQRKRMLLGYCNHYKSVTSHYEEKKKFKTKMNDWK